MEEEDKHMVAILCGDEKTKGYVAPDLTREEEDAVQGAIIRHKAKALRSVLLYTIQHVWFDNKHSFKMKLLATDADPMAYPKYFTKEEIVVWKFLVISRADWEGPWYFLPGPAHMWPQGYKYEENGWVLPAMSFCVQQKAKNIVDILEGCVPAQKDF